MLYELSIDEIEFVSGGDGRSQAAIVGSFIQGAFGGAAIGATAGAFFGGFVFGVGAAPGVIVGGGIGGLIGGGWNVLHEVQRISW